MAAMRPTAQQWPLPSGPPLAPTLEPPRVPGRAPALAPVLALALAPAQAQAQARAQAPVRAQVTCRLALLLQRMHRKCVIYRLTINPDAQVLKMAGMQCAGRESG